MTILPPLRDFGARPSDASGPELKAGASTPSSGQMRRWALAAAAVVMTAGVAGAFAVAGMAHFGADPSAASSAKAAVSASLVAENETLKQTIAKLGTDVTELRTALDRATKASSAQLGRVTDRIDRMEKAQVEPNARLARLTETVDKLNATPKAQAQASTPAAAQAAADKAAPNTAATKNADVTGSISAPAQAAAASEPKKPPIIDGWRIHEVDSGGALIQGPYGMFDVVPGDPLPGLNRVEAIRREGGRWVVVTRKGWIVAR